MNLICGINPVMEALNAGVRHFDRLLVVKGIRNQRVSEAIARASQLGIPLRFEPRETLDRMAGGIPHQGLVAVVSAKPVVTMEDLLDRARTPALVVLLDGVEDPRNLGAILRTVDAAGADGVLLPDRHSAGLSESVSRSSAGGLEHVQVARIGNVSQAIDALKARGIWVVGLDASGTERWDAVDYRRPIALVLGGEGRGIRRLVRERCDHLVSLPLFGHVGSLNVSVAAGIALYEVVRQRGSVPSHVRPIPKVAPTAERHVRGPGEDDGEHDPGDRAPARAAYGRGGPADEDELDDRHPASLPVDDLDHPAWNTGPTVLAEVRGRGAHGGPRRPPPRRHGKPRPGPRANTPADVPPELRPAGPRPEGQAGRRRRRKRGGRSGGAGAPGEPRNGAPPSQQDGRDEAPRDPGRGPEDGGGAQSPGNGPEGAGRPRRRGRRRRR
jgi:23S rRNA (guanosine2251-2'-O)-methyltransferase